MRKYGLVSGWCGLAQDMEGWLVMKWAGLVRIMGPKGSTTKKQPKTNSNPGDGAFGNQFNVGF